MKYTTHIISLHVRHLFVLVGILACAVFVLPGSVHAAGATCTDGTTGCGFTNFYNMGIESCALKGSDISGGNRILGGETCSIGGADNAGFSMRGNSEPNDSTPYFANPGTVAPGWSYDKTYLSHSSIPSGEFNDDPYYNIKFFGGPVSVSLSAPDDDSRLSVGSNVVSWSGCSALVTDVNKGGCPSRTFSGSTSFNANPGDAIVFSVTNRLRPNNGFGTWGAGNAGVVLGTATECYTAAYFNTTGGRSGGYPVVNYHPTADGQCSPDVVVVPPPACKINTFTATNPAIVTGASDTLNWNVTPNGQSIVIDQSVGTMSTPAGTVSVTPTQTTTYTMTCGNASATATIIVSRPAAAIGLSVPANVAPAGDSWTGSIFIWNAGKTGSLLKNVSCRQIGAVGVNSSNVIVDCTSLSGVAYYGSN